MPTLKIKTTVKYFDTSNAELITFVYLTKPVIARFNNWENDKLAQEWLVAMSYKVEEIEYVRAEKIKGRSFLNK